MSGTSPSTKSTFHSLCGSSPPIRSARVSICRVSVIGKDSQMGNDNHLRFWPFSGVGLGFVLLITVDASAEFPLITCLRLCHVLGLDVCSR